MLRVSARRGTQATLLALGALAFPLSGCHHSYGSDPSGPATRLLGVGAPALLTEARQTPGARAHLPYPLAVGNHWEYAMHFVSTITTPDGEHQPPETFDGAFVSEITGTVETAGHLYFIDEESDPAVAAPPQRFRQREDRSGYFELDAPGPVLKWELRVPGGASEAIAASLAAWETSLPSVAAHAEAWQRAAAVLATKVAAARSSGAPLATADIGGPGPGEISLLRFPLTRGASWIVRDSPRFAREVVARERVSTPAGDFTAWKVVGTNEFFGAGDFSTFWYGDAGLLRVRVHVTSEATDDQGNVIGRLDFDSDQVLSDVSLAGAGPGGPIASLRPAR